MNSEEPIVAVISIRRPYINPTENSFISALGDLGDKQIRLIDITPLLRDDCRHLLDVFLSQVRRARCAILSNYVLACFEHQAQSPVFSMVDGKVDTVAHVREFLDRVYELDIPKIVSAMLYDVHDPDLANYVRKFGKDGVIVTARFPRQWEGDVFSIDGAAVATNQATLREHLVIEAPHCVPQSEFASLDGPKVWRVAVPGVGYSRRIIARRSLDWRDRWVAPPFSLVGFPLKGSLALRRLTGWSRPERMYYSIANRAHQHLLALTHMVYTDGAVTDYAVRKYFEIPAAGSLLLCTPFNGMKDLGFVDGVTHVECDPQNVGKLARTLDVKSASVRKMIRAGQGLVWLKHSSEARATQVLRAARAAAVGRLKSARWANGEFILDT